MKLVKRLKKVVIERAKIFCGFVHSLQENLIQYSPGIADIKIVEKSAIADKFQPKKALFKASEPSK